MGEVQRDRSCCHSNDLWRPKHTEPRVRDQRSSTSSPSEDHNWSTNQPPKSPSLKHVPPYARRNGSATECTLTLPRIIPHPSCNPHNDIESGVEGERVLAGLAIDGNKALGPHRPSTNRHCHALNKSGTTRSNKVARPTARQKDGQDRPASRSPWWCW